MPTESRTKNLAPHSLEVGGSGYGFGITAGGADRNSGGQIAGGRGTYSSLSLLNNLSLFQSASASTSLACNSDQSFRLPLCWLGHRDLDALLGMGESVYVRVLAFKHGQATNRNLPPGGYLQHCASKCAEAHAARPSGGHPTHSACEIVLARGCGRD